MKKLRGVLVDVENETVKVLEIEDKLDEFYRILNCTCIDIVVRNVHNHMRYNIICDDEGLFKEPTKISGIGLDYSPELVGNLFIVGGEVIDGELTSLTDEELSWLLRFIKKMPTKKYPAGYPMLTHIVN